MTKDTAQVLDRCASFLVDLSLDELCAGFLPQTRHRGFSTFSSHRSLEIGVN